MQCGFKIYSIYRKILMLLFTEKAEWCIFFILGATLRIWETAKYENVKGDR